MVICFNCGKNSYFAISCLKLKDIGNIKEIEEEKMSNKLEKEEPQGKTPPQCNGTLQLRLQWVLLLGWVYRYDKNNNVITTGGVVA